MIIKRVIIDWGKDREIIEEFEKNEKEGKVSFNTIDEIIKK